MSRRFSYFYFFLCSFSGKLNDGNEQFAFIIHFISVLGMHLFGGQFCTLQGFNKTSRQQFTMNCRCCTCVEVITVKNSTDLKDVTCEFDRPNFDTLRGALLTVFQVKLHMNFNS